MQGAASYLATRLKERKAGVPLDQKAQLRRTLAVMRKPCAHLGADLGRAWGLLRHYAFPYPGGSAGVIVHRHADAGLPSGRPS